MPRSRYSLPTRLARRRVGSTWIYLEHCHLRETPFTITPALYFLFSAICHQQVIDKIGRRHRS